MIGSFTPLLSCSTATYDQVLLSKHVPGVQASSATVKSELQLSKPVCHLGQHEVQNGWSSWYVLLRRPCGKANWKIWRP
eukprot:793706-Pelagomonas_calceolata.AAC.3